MVPGLNLIGRVNLSEAKLGRADVRQWLARAAVWFETLGDVVLDTQLDRDSEGRPVLLVSLHPVSEDVVVRIAPSGCVRVQGSTAAVGPGYHAYLCATLHAFAEDFGIAWNQVIDPTGFSRRADLTLLNDHFLRSHSRACGDLESTMDGSPVALGLPGDHGFSHPGPILTPLGPRSLAWLASAASDPNAVRDSFPWWSPEPDAELYRNRALALLWCEFPWRPPLTECEGELTDQIAADLEMAHALDSTGPLPWQEWAEVLSALANDRLGLTVQRIDPELGREVLRRAEGLTAPGPLVGYRHYPIRIAVEGGWSVEVPGSFAEGWDADGRSWIGWDAGRRVTLRVGAGADSFAPEFAEARDETGQRVWRLAGVAQSNGSEPLAYRIDVADLADRGWAETVWRSLKHAPVPASSVA